MQVYKGFDKDFKCLNFQYEVGKTYETDSAKLCESGFHACIEPIDVISYYQDRFAIVELEEVSKDRDDDSKICGKKITILKELSKDEFKEVIEKTWNNCNNPYSMLRYLGRTSGATCSPERKKLLKTLLDIVSLCKPCKNKQVESLRQECIKVGYDYCNDKATLDELKIARSKLWNTAYYASSAAYYASYAAVAAADAAYAAVYAEKADVTSEQQLEIIRQNYPIPPKINTKRE